MRAFALIHVVNKEPVFRGELTKRAILIPISEIKLIEELPDGGALIYLADGGVFETVESFQALKVLFLSGD